MAKVVPFKAVHYNTSRFGQDVTRFAAPPYDVIDRPAEKALKDDRLNIAHITLGDQGDSYATAAKRLRTWLHDEVLVQDDGEAFYLYEQTFKGPDGRPVVRTGVVGLVRLEEFSKGVILPHERTIPKHKADRLELMKAVGGYTEQVFMLYDDPSGGVERLLQELRRREELLRFVDTDGVHHRIVRVGETRMVERISSLLAPLRLLIADGHHRYETALKYRAMRREAEGEDGERPYDFIMATLVGFGNPGLVILPTHRLVRGLEEERLAGLRGRLSEEFELTDLAGPAELVDALGRARSDAFGVWLPAKGSATLAVAKRTPEDPLCGLSVQVLQERVLKGMLGYTQDMLDGKVGIEYVKGTEASVAAMATGEHQACFFVRPPSADQVMEVASSGEKMPQKSTYFFPKIWSGTLLYLF
ncbi:MAG TPA: DUF1015 domain-containing protein [Thermoplasmata archaeon]|nr:DUF1015 domain-containing protein [Thermoplasmata archaeon]